jgi:RNA polymerase sigma-70 factor (ECF subfamily)
MPSTAPSTPDDELVDRMRRADERALGTLYDRHAAFVHGITRAITGADADAEEVTEAVFLQIWNRADEFDSSRGDLRTYLAMVARSRALDLVRSRRSRERAHERSAADDTRHYSAPVSSVGGDPEVEVLRREARSELDRLLGELNEQQREAIELAFFHGLTQSEIAREVGAPLGTVKTRIRDGMSKLRDAATRERLEL